MSISGVVFGTIMQNDLASKLEDQYQKLIDKIDKVADLSADLGEKKSIMESKEDQNRTRVQIVTQQMANEQDEGKKGKLGGLIQRFLGEIQAIITEKLKSQLEINKFEKLERKLTKEKVVLEARRTVAMNAAKTNEKLLPAAISRFSVTT